MEKRISFSPVFWLPYVYHTAARVVRSIIIKVLIVRNGFSTDPTPWQKEVNFQPHGKTVERRHPKKNQSEQHQLTAKAQYSRLTPSLREKNTELGPTIMESFTEFGLRLQGLESSFFRIVWVCRHSAFCSYIPSTDAGLFTAAFATYNDFRDCLDGDGDEENCGRLIELQDASGLYNGAGSSSCPSSSSSSCRGAARLDLIIGDTFLGGSRPTCPVGTELVLEITTSQLAAAREINSLELSLFPGAIFSSSVPSQCLLQEDGKYLCDGRAGPITMRFVDETSPCQPTGGGTPCPIPQTGRPYGLCQVNQACERRRRELLLLKGESTEAEKATRGSISSSKASGKNLTVLDETDTEKNHQRRLDDAMSPETATGPIFFDVDMERLGFSSSRVYIEVFCRQDQFCSYAGSSDPVVFADLSAYTEDIPSDTTDVVLEDGSALYGEPRCPSSRCGAVFYRQEDWTYGIRRSSCPTGTEMELKIRDGGFVEAIKFVPGENAELSGFLPPGCSFSANEGYYSCTARGRTMTIRFTAKSAPCQPLDGKPCPLPHGVAQAYGKCGGRATNGECIFGIDAYELIQRTLETPRPTISPLTQELSTIAPSRASAVATPLPVFSSTRAVAPSSSLLLFPLFFLRLFW